MHLIPVWIFLLAGVLVIYLPSLNGGFLFDDVANIVENPAIHLNTLSIPGLLDSLTGLSAGPLGRPVSVWSFALTHFFFGLDAYAFKAINLGIHLLNGLLIGWFVALLLEVLALRGLSERAKKWLPAWVATAWLLHPIHFVAISMAVQRMTLLASMFTLLALIAHLKAVNRSGSLSTSLLWVIAGWLVFWPLACLSKETGLLFPCFALLITFCAKPAGGFGLNRRRVIAQIALAIAFTGGLMIWLLGWSWLAAGYAVRDFTLGERLLTEARVLWFYLAQTVVPSPTSFALYLDWIPVSRGFLEPVTTLVALIAWGLVAVGVIVHRQKLPIVAFGLLWFLIGHGLESTFVPLEIAHEHRNYLPALGPLLAIAFCAASLFERLPPGQQKAIPITAALAFLLLLATLTALRSMQMANPLIGSQIEATRHETSARANYVAAWALIKAGLGDQGDPVAGNSIRFYFEQAERSDSGFKLGYLSLITWSCASQREVERQWIDNFSKKLQTTAFSYGQLALPAYLLRPLVAMPDCLQRADVLRLFEAGSHNPRLRGEVRARFLEAAGDYVLVVGQDPEGASKYYHRAVEFDPANINLRSKQKGFPPSQ